MSRLLELKNFHYSYGNIHVVKGIDLYVDEGEIITLIGANGAGKTTTMQTISGLTGASGVSGEILFAGSPSRSCRAMRSQNGGFARCWKGVIFFLSLRFWKTWKQALICGRIKRM